MFLKNLGLNVFGTEISSDIVDKAKKNFKSLSIGIPKESSLQEKRVALTPESVELLTNCGHKVYVEKDAGNFSNFYNEEYTKYGAVITDKIE